MNFKNAFLVLVLLVCTLVHLSSCIARTISKSASNNGRSIGKWGSFNGNGVPMVGKSPSYRRGGAPMSRSVSKPRSVPKSYSRSPSLPKRVWKPTYCREDKLCSYAGTSSINGCSSCCYRQGGAGNCIPNGWRSEMTCQCQQTN